MAAARKNRPKSSVSEPAKPEFADKRHRDLWICLLLAAAIWAVYAQVSTHDFINYDDPQYITENPLLRDGLTWSGVLRVFTSPYAGFWFPLTWVSLMLDVQFFGFQSGLHHLTNVALHTISSLLIFTLLARITGARWRSAFVAFAFALHPLHVESVAWATERKDVLSTLFWCLTLWTYVRYVDRTSAARYVLVLFTFSCGLMAKPMIVTLPFILLLLDYWPLGRVPKAGWRVIFEKLPLLALSGATAVVTYIAQHGVGSVSSVEQAPILVRLGNVLAAYVTYVIQFFWPANLAIFYPYISDRPVWQPIAAAVLLLAITIGVVKAIRLQPYLAVGWFWYLGALVPVIGLVQSGAQSHADRYTYVPMIGISIMLAWGVAEIFEKRRWPVPALAALAASVCCVWCVVTWRNLGYWQNSISLFQHAASVTEGNYIAHNNLGDAFKRAGRVTEATEEFAAAVRIHPQDAISQDNLGETLVSQGRLDEARPHLAEAVRMQPDLPKPHVDLGNALVQTGQIDAAAKQYQLALQLRPDSGEANYGLGAILMNQGRKQEARLYLERAVPPLSEVVRRQPDYADGHYNLAALLSLLGRNDEAIAQLTETIRLQPDDAGAHFNLGTAFASKQRYNEAIHEFSEALRLKPDFEDARRSLEKYQLVRK